MFIPLAKSLQTIVEDIQSLEVSDQEKKALLLGITLGNLGIPSDLDREFRTYLEKNQEMNTLFLRYFPEEKQAEQPNQQTTDGT